LLAGQLVFFDLIAGNLHASLVAPIYGHSVSRAAVQPTDPLAPCCGETLTFKTGHRLFVEIRASGLPITKRSAVTPDGLALVTIGG
jgi:hypothetical protein